MLFKEDTQYSINNNQVQKETQNISLKPKQQKYHPIQYRTEERKQLKSFKKARKTQNNYVYANSYSHSNANCIISH